MTLSDWAKKYGLDYLNSTDSPGPCAEYGIEELAWERSHCLDCSVWYVYRDLDSKQLYRYVVLGDSKSVIEIEQSDLDTLDPTNLDHFWMEDDL